MYWLSTVLNFQYAGCQPECCTDFYKLATDTHCTQNVVNNSKIEINEQNKDRTVSTNNIYLGLKLCHMHIYLGYELLTF